MSYTIKLQSSDNVIFVTDIEVAKSIGIVKNMFDDLGMLDDDVIPLTQVNSAILRIILQWALHHKNDNILEMRNENYQMTIDDITPWDREFLRVYKKQLYDLMTAANYLDVGYLLDIACVYVADSIKGKRPEQLRAIYNIPNDFGPIEAQEVAMETKWSEGK